MGNNWTTQLNGYNIYGAEENGEYFTNTNYKLFNNPIIRGVNFRKGVRNGCFVKDEELVLSGFSLPEGIGWQNIFSIC